MKKNLWVLVFLLAGCHKEPGSSVQSGQLIGNWSSLSDLPSANEKPFTGWTFKPDYVYTLPDKLKTCQPVTNSSTMYKYWIDGADVLVMHYAGITNGLIPIPDIRRRILSVTANELILDSPREVLEKCP